MAKLLVCDKFGDTLEYHEFEGSLLDWIKANTPSYKELPRPPYSATLNGKTFPYDAHDVELVETDSVVLTLEPQDPVTIVFAVVALVSAAYSIYTINNLPTYENSSEPGKSIYSPNARANTASPSGLIREVAGKPTIFPDLPCPIRRKYIDNKEYLYVMLSVGAGYFDLKESNIYISETPITAYQSDIVTEIFEPGDDVSFSAAAENWYTSKEVASLRLTTASTPESGVWTLDASGATFTSYLDGVATAFPYTTGERFDITTGSNIGAYEVQSISGTDSEIATVTILELADAETGRLEAVAQAPRNLGLSRSASSTVLRRIYEDNGAPTLTTVSGESVEWSGINGGVNWEGPFVGTPEGELTQFAEFDIIFPQGLTDNNNDATVDIDIQWREYGTAEWNSLFFTSFTENTYDQVVKTLSQDFGSLIRPEFRFRRVTKDSESIELVDIVEIERVKCKLETPTSYPDITTIGMRLAGTNALASTAENKVNIRGATRKLPTLQQIRDAIAGTPYDLSASETTTETTYDVFYGEFLSATGISEDSPDQNLPTAINISDDGLRLITSEGVVVKSFTLSTAYDTSTKVYDDYITFGATGINYTDSIAWGDSGNYIIKMQREANPSPYSTVDIRELNTAYDITSGTASSSFYQFSGAEADGNTAGIIVNERGTKVWLGNQDSQTITQYSLSTEWDASTITYDSVSLDVSGELGDNSSDSDNDLWRIWVGDFDGSENPQRITIISKGGMLYQYTLTTAGDLSTATWDGNSIDMSSHTNDSIVITANNFYTTETAGNVNAAIRYRLGDAIDTAATRSIVRFVVNALYETMGDDAEQFINWDDLEALDTLLQSREDYLDAEFIDETTLWEAIRIALAPGYCEATIKDALFNAVRTTTGSDYTELYTPDVMVDDLRTDNTHYDPQEPDGIDVEYFSLETNQMEVVQCRYDSEAGVNPKRIQLIGVTSEEKAWRYGMRERMRLRLKPALYTFSTELDALNSDYGDPIAIASDLFVSQYGEVTAYSGSTVTLDFEPTIGAGTHYAAFRNREGQLSGLYTITAGASANQITLGTPSTLDFTPVTDGSMDSTFVSIGTSDEWGVRGIVRRITPSDDNIVEVEAEEYVAEVYANDDLSPP